MAKLITVTGNSCKTVFSFLLAQHLSQKYRCALISTDGFQPGYATLMPSKPERADDSLGRLLTIVSISQSDILTNGDFINNNLFMLSYRSGQTPMTFPEITPYNMDELIRCLSEITDFIIVDTSTSKSKFDRLVRAKSDLEICLITADGRGLAYVDSYKCMASLNILVANSKYCQVSAIAHQLGSKVKYCLPYFRSLGAIYNGVDITAISPSGSYIKILRKVAVDCEQVLHASGQS